MYICVYNTYIWLLDFTNLILKHKLPYNFRKATLIHFRVLVVTILWTLITEPHTETL